MPTTKSKPVAKRGAGLKGTRPTGKTLARPVGRRGDKENVAKSNERGVAPSIPLPVTVTACYCPHCQELLDLKAMGLGFTKAKLTPCVQCGHPLSQRQRIKPCPQCAKNNWKEVQREAMGG